MLLCMSKHVRSSLAMWFVLAMGCAAARADDKFGQLTVEEVAAKLGQKLVYVFDNNPRELYQKAHVPGAKWIDYKNIQSSDLPADKNATLIFYCANEH